jgi:hypothetical protein
MCARLAPGTVDAAMGTDPRSGDGLVDLVAATTGRFQGGSPCGSARCDQRCPGPHGGTAIARLIVITTTSAAALAAGSALESVAREERTDALILLTLLTGLIMVVAAFASCRAVPPIFSHSVMLG